MQVLLTETAHRQFGAALGDAEALRMQADGSLVGPAGPVSWDEARPEVAWATADLFEDGAPLRPFFGFVLRSESLRWFQSGAAGVDHPVFAALLERGVRLTTSHVTDVPIAEYVLRAVLEHYQQPQRWVEARGEASWAPHDFREVEGSTWVVVGVGAIGSAVARRARAFGAALIGVRRTPDGTEPVDRMVHPDELRATVSEANVVVLAAPANPATHHLVDADLLAAMAPGSILVNIARGSLVDEAALLSALDRGVPELAVLDVTDPEPPPPESLLWTHPAVVLTPHTAAGGTGRYHRGADVFAANLAAYRAGEPLRHEVTDPETP